MAVLVAINGGVGTNRLTDARCRAARSGPGIRKLADGKGSYLAVMPNGSKLWRLKYRFAASKKRFERLYPIGTFPEVSLADARVERDRARGWLRDDKDPTIERRVAKAAEAAKQSTSFAAVADERLARQHFSDQHLTAQRRLFDCDVIEPIFALRARIDAPQRNRAALFQFPQPGIADA